MVIAGMRGNVEDPEGMVEAIDGRFDAMGGKAEAMLAIGGGRLATIGGRPLDGLALDSRPDRLPGWQSKNKTPVKAIVEPTIMSWCVSSSVLLTWWAISISKSKYFLIHSSVTLNVCS